MRVIESQGSIWGHGQERISNWEFQDSETAGEPGKGLSPPLDWARDLRQRPEDAERARIRRTFGVRVDLGCVSVAQTSVCVVFPHFRVSNNYRCVRRQLWLESKPVSGGSQTEVCATKGHRPGSATLATESLVPPNCDLTNSSKHLTALARKSKFGSASMHFPA
jgi:hypothetical protein